MLNFFKTYINSKNYSILMFLCVIMGLIEVYTATMVPLEIKNLIDSISKGSNLSVFFSYSMKIIAFVSIGSLISILTNAYTKKHTLDVSDSVRSGLIEKILGSKYENYLSLNTNDVYSSISSKLDSLVNFFTSEIRVLFISILTIVSSLIFMIIIDYKMMLLIMVIIVLFSFTLFFLSRRNAALEKISDLEKDKFLSVMRNILEEVDIIKCCGSHHIVMRKLSEILIRYKNIRNKIIVRNSISEPLSSFFVSISILAVMSLGAYQVHRNYITSGDLIAFIVFVFNLSVPLMRIVSFSKNYNTSIVNLISVGKITDLPEELQKGTTCVPHTGDGLSFRDVKFEYKSNRDRNLFIKSAEIPNNSFVLIKGESGNGKTTFLNILNMLLHPKSGDITYNGIPISDINTKSWRKIIGYVPQNPKLLRGTIEDNIRFGIGDLDLDKTIDIAEALKIAKCDNFVSEFNQKSSSRVIVDGETFSGGEIQRIAIARAIIRDPRILILDEPTAHLDEDNRNAVISAIISSSKERTVLIVSHDMEIEEFVTHIASVKNGEVYIKRRNENKK